MTPERCHAITSRYSDLRIAVIGDFCLDRYFEIDPAKAEKSIETGLTVHNIVNVRCQPGAAGTILNNLVALGVPHLHVIGFCGTDGEGFELRRSLAARRGVSLDHFVQTGERRTFTYTKPLVIEPGKAPAELNRLDIKNWTPTPAEVRSQICRAFLSVADELDAAILMDQVDLPETGVVTGELLATVRGYVGSNPDLLMIADSRRSLKDYPPVQLKMNSNELAALTGATKPLHVEEVKAHSATLAQRQRRNVFVTMAEQGIVGAAPTGEVHHVPALPVRGEIDIVGAGDAVTANLTAALAAGATLRESLELAMAAASIVIHQLGTTGTASIAQLQQFIPA
ncbi:MAG: PfkB family carbohydrate kinase [Verrucomicrobiales bacterium]|nr:PfkB family carbohydrate kinase [Verrucomicrobiales bacterium]